MSRLRSLLFSPRLLGAGFVALALVGCGGSGNARVSGRVVRKDGTPLVGARVLARCEDTKKSAYGTTDADGKYDLNLAQLGDGVEPGKYTISIVENRGGFDSRAPATIAAKYSDGQTSGLAFEASAGAKVDLEIKLDPK